MAEVHQNSAQQIPSSPTRWVTGEWVVGCVTDAPNEVEWAGLGKVQLACFHKCSALVSILDKLVHVRRENDVVPMSFPALLVEAGNRSAESLLYGGIGNGADA